MLDQGSHRACSILTKLLEAAVKLWTTASSYPTLTPRPLPVLLLHHHMPANVPKNMMAKYINMGTIVLNTGPMLSRICLACWAKMTMMV
jgi:hypothetical protein